MSKAVIFFAPGLEECEGLITVDLLRRARVEVTIAAVGGERTIVSSHKISIVADALAEELDYSTFDAVILPGGLAGVKNLKADAAVCRVCCEFAAAGKLVAAICAAPTALAAFGLVEGRRVTVYPGDDLIAEVKAAGGDYVGGQVVEDGQLITGEALGAAIPFALTLAARLASPAEAERVGKAIVYKG